MKSQIEQDLAWIHRGKHRLRVLKKVAELGRKGLRPGQVEVLTGIGLPQGGSDYGNGRLAILGLLERGLLENEADKPRKYALKVNWDVVQVYSDWLEEHGKERLAVESLKP